VQVWYDPTRQWTDNTLLDPASYIVDYERGKLTAYLMVRGDAQQSLKVVHAGGYAIDTATGTLTTSADPELKMACIVQTVHLFTRLQPDNIGVQTDREQGKVGAGTFMTRGGLTPEAANMLWRFKRMNVGRY
jgi:hypothetical protein